MSNIAEKVVENIKKETEKKYINNPNLYDIRKVLVEKYNYKYFDEAGKIYKKIHYEKKDCNK